MKKPLVAAFLCIGVTYAAADPAQTLFDNGKIRQACKLWLKQAEAGVAKSQNEVAVCFQDGSLRKSPKKARYWYRAAANQGQMFAQFNLAVMLEKGQGGAKDIKEAIVWYTKAANQGDGPAMYNLGNLYIRTGDKKSARRWLKKAARAGIPEALNNLEFIN